ncbi:MAG: aminotransferase class I/II-fold pyridoxal phosphate-dependent enzyme [Bacteroidetes bacterium]|nr:aminotransferase class I/II-fold pyridoxal phosphate-dependent enzyme [Bacteroidota bacterium]
MSSIFSDRISDVPRSFIREILKVTVDKDVISFAGGLPNRELFPVEQLKQASAEVFDEAGKEALQYSNSEGYLPLREYIAKRYKTKNGLEVNPENILITNGSQQGLDLMAKIFLNETDDVMLEEPGYLGAIQAFQVYRASFNAVRLEKDGADIEHFKQILKHSKPKLFYTVPNFQNPSGISYSDEKRKIIAQLLTDKPIIVVEDDPYGDLRYTGREKKTFKSLMPEKTILLGTFSKTVVPSFRLGWLVAPAAYMERLVIAKQAADLHTNYFIQRLIFKYLSTHKIDSHIAVIRDRYDKQRTAMIAALRKYFPEGVDFTLPEGGMFLWVMLPEGISTMKLFDIAIQKKVAFVPGNPFYTDGRETNTLRLNFSCVDENLIDEGIKRLAEATRELLSTNKDY